MKKILFLCQIIIFISALIISCSKDYPCSGDCVSIHISGKVIDTATNIGIPNVPIHVYWKSAGMCFFCSTTKITDHLTNSRGEFDFNVKVDNSKFAWDYINITASIPKGYINYFANTDEIDIYYLSRYESQINDLRVIMYPKANLAIKFIKNQNSSYQLFESYYKYGPVTGIHVYDKWGVLTDSTFNVITAANIYTKIIWRKVYSPGVWTWFSDSIKCSPINNNVFILNY